MKAMSKESEMKVADMKDTLSGFKFLTPKETKKSMKSGNLAKFLKGFDTPRGTVTTKFLPQFLKVKLQAPMNIIGAYFFIKISNIVLL